MGYYINSDSKGNDLPATGKVEMLLADGATPTDASYKENLVCVVKNNSILGKFEAAGYAFSKHEFDVFNEPNDNRPKTWLVYPHAKQCSGYKS